MHAIKTLPRRVPCDAGCPDRAWTERRSLRQLRGFGPSRPCELAANAKSDGASGRAREVASCKCTNLGDAWPLTSPKRARAWTERPLLRQGWGFGPCRPHRGALAPRSRAWVGTRHAGPAQLRGSVMASSPSMACSCVVLALASSHLGKVVPNLLTYARPWGGPHDACQKHGGFSGGGAWVDVLRR